MQPSDKNIGLLLLRHLSTHGLIALLVAVVSLVLLRGLSLGLVLMFALPPTAAAFLTQPHVSRAGRWIAWSFLAMVGMGSIIAWVPLLFPRLGGFSPQLDPWHDRMLSWYSGVYLVWFMSVVPITSFMNCLIAHKRHEPAQISQPTCYLGLLVSGLCSVGLPAVLGTFLGFWPVF